MITDLSTCFDLFERSAFRLETLSFYTVASETARLRAFRLRLPMPERSVRTSPWLARINRTTAAGKTWQRIRIVDSPLSDYQRYQMIGYQESQTAGDVIFVAEHRPELEGLTRDFWLFDEETDHPVAALMSYDEEGAYLCSDITGDPETIQACRNQKRLAQRFAMPLNIYLAQRRAA